MKNLKQIKITSGEVYFDSLIHLLGTYMTLITKDGEILHGKLRKSGGAFGLAIDDTCILGTNAYCSKGGLKIGGKENFIKELYIHLNSSIIGQ